MGTGDDEKSGKKQPAARDGVSRDTQGNAVWQWAVDSGKHLMESTSLLLKRLEVPGLKLEEDAAPEDKKIDVQSGRPTEPPVSAGYDPYGSKRVSAKSAARPAPKRPAATKPAVTPRPRRSWWQRLFRRD
jgi:hypothetical protein